MTKYHITVEDRRIDAANGRKARGSTWHKGKKRSRSSGDTVRVKGYYKSDGTYVRGYTKHITAADRRKFASNGRKARGW